MIHFLTLLLTVPPVPPPPADRYAAAKEMIHATPLPPYLKTQLRDKAVTHYSYSVMPYSKSNDYARRRIVEQLIARRIPDDKQFDDYLDGCMIESIGWKYDLSTLGNIRKVLATPGGSVLWNENIIPTVEQCYKTVMPDVLQSSGFDSAIRWFSMTGRNRALPYYDAANTTLDVLSTQLADYCGVPAKKALTRRSNQLGISDNWAHGRRNSSAVTCLVQSAKLAGYDLPILQTDGSTVIMIIAS